MLKLMAPAILINALATTANYFFCVNMATTNLKLAVS